jgi:hypothetical protein
MRSKISVSVALVAAAALVALTASVALGATTRTFTASYKGKVTERVNGNIVNATARGTGSGNIVGRSSVSGSVVANSSNPPCGPFTGPGSIKSSKGLLKVKVLPGSRGCAAGQDDQNNISLIGNLKFVGGTNKFKKAKGSVHFSGHYDRGTGAFTVKLTGKITY